MYTILRKTNNKRFRNIWKNDKKSLLFQILIELWAFRKKNNRCRRMASHNCKLSPRCNDSVCTEKTHPVCVYIMPASILPKLRVFARFSFLLTLSLIPNQFPLWRTEGVPNVQKEIKTVWKSAEKPPALTSPVKSFGLRRPLTVFPVVTNGFVFVTVW